MVKQAKQALRAMQNPQVAINQIIRQNPQINSVISQYGSIDGAINAICRQQGIDVNEFMNAINND